MEPEELAVYVRLAEKEVLPIIKKKKLSPGTAQFLLAQYTQMLVTGKNTLTTESAMAVSNAVMTLWEAGYYTPGPEYPYTLAETVQEIEEGLKAKENYAVQTERRARTKHECVYQVSAWGDIGMLISNHL